MHIPVGVTKTDMNTKSESTYRLLVSSQEKGRTALEILIFVLCIFSIVVVIWQFAQTSLETFEPGVASCIACHTSGPKLPTRS
jgi:hypothetical protein